MKKLFTVLAFVLLTASVFAQSPEKMNYQAVIRDASDNLVTSQQIGMQISILQGSASGSAIYVETQESSTNTNGLVSIEIGTGAVESGDFTTIDWKNGPYFIKTETDPDGATGGISYTITGTSQLLSVPYALHAKTAETLTGGISETDPIFGASVAIGITGTDTSNWNNKQDQLVAGSNISIVGNIINSTGCGSSSNFYLGQDTLGGIVFYIYIDQNGDQRGLIVSKTETTAKWQNTGVLVNADRTDDGQYNTDLMSDSPAKTWVTSLGAGWYLPSTDELILLWNNRFHVNKTARAISSTLLSTNAYYWSSMESFVTMAFCVHFFNGLMYDSLGKTSSNSVRAVRAF